MNPVGPLGRALRKIRTVAFDSTPTGPELGRRGSCAESWLHEAAHYVQIWKGLPYNRTRGWPNDDTGRISEYFDDMFSAARRANWPASESLRSLARDRSDAAEIETHAIQYLAMQRFGIALPLDRHVLVLLNSSLFSSPTKEELMTKIQRLMQQRRIQKLAGRLVRSVRARLR